MKILHIAILAASLAAIAPAARAENVIHASEIVRARVANAAGQVLGKIEGMLLDTRPRGQHFVILARPDGKRFGYPVNAFRRAGERLLALYVPERNLEISPGYGDVREALQPDGAQRYVRARNVIGQPIRDVLGRQAGVVEDLAVSLETARTQFALVDFGDGRVLPMPAHAVRLSPDGPATLDPDSQRRS